MDESHRLYSDTTREVGQLQLYLDTIEVALFASERETAAAQVAAIDA